MNSPSSNDLFNNLEEISKKYKKVISLLMQGKGSIIPSTLLDKEKTSVMFNQVMEKLLEDPQKFLKLNMQFGEKFHQLIDYSIKKFLGHDAQTIKEPLAKDKRFKDPAWKEWIFFDFAKQFYLLSSDLVQNYIKEFELDDENEKYLEFLTKQFVDAFSPTNFLLSNPVALKEYYSSGGENLLKGLDNFLDDIGRSEELLKIQMTDHTYFKLGHNIAATKGKIVYENELMQLICYEPKQECYAVPLFIVPPWINKYYILDLSENNSLIKWLVDNNFKVFLVSWVNPDKELSSKNFEDYMDLGIVKPVEYILKNFGYKKINTVGYCIGGTLLSTALAYFKAINKDYIKSATFFTTLLDFEEPGELKVFINPSTIGTIEKDMQEKGYFDGKYLSNSFSLLRANDLVWSFFVNNYLLGKKPIPFDILYWNNDSTNLPSTMHSYYLRNMYLNNLLKVPDALSMLGTPINLKKINQPCFFLAAEDDHIAPWKSIYSGLSLFSSQLKFCLTGSGHVAGVINHPLAKKYGYRVNENLSENPDDWFKAAEIKEGSWWEYWRPWLLEHSGKLEKSDKYNKASSIEPAPGRYAMQSSIT